ncbi:hypothetical protein E2C01_032025 [Portunus trituberculatus]|uniref:Uncharacterized protein n=1 Tax=Portunus trituberculatus TaxID=210409 RepID=A0A5B7EZU3_PORTR|nr:hypothetical protein [Portunus trituberculatus]
MATSDPDWWRVALGFTVGSRKSLERMLQCDSGCAQAGMSGDGVDPPSKCLCENLLGMKVSSALTQHLPLYA